MDATGHSHTGAGVSNLVSDLPVLYIFAGLPGSGKTTVAMDLARQLRAAYLRIDTVEQALRDLCSLDVRSEGYALAYRLAADNLRVGTSVVADSCNPVESTRVAWKQVAVDAGAHFVNIEVICSDRSTHRRRVETRNSTVAGLRMPTWEEVEARAYQEWVEDRIVLDTSGKLETASLDELLSEISRRTPKHRGAESGGARR